VGLINNQLSFRDTVATPFFLLPEDQLWEIYRWRNDPQIRCWMEHTSPIGPDEHRIFVRHLMEAEDQTYLRVDTICRPDVETRCGVGVINLTQVTTDRYSAEIGLYRNPNREQPGSGGLLMELIEFVAKNLGIHTLKLKVRRENASAIRLYQRFGYVVVQTTEDFEYQEKHLQGE